MKVLITGICGFAGSTLAYAWLEADSGVTIYGIDNLVRPGSELNRTRLRKAGVTFFHGDIRLPSDFESLPQVDWVIDAAANPSVLAGFDGPTSSRQLVEHNLLGTLNILEFCKRNKAGLILISTSRVYSIATLTDLPLEPVGNAFHLNADRPALGVSSFGVSEDCSTGPPRSLYGSTKFASEILALEYHQAFGFPVWINRCGVLGGAGQFGRVDQGIFSYWVNSWKQRHPLTYMGFGGKGYQVRDCLHPRDLIPLLQKQTTTADGSARTVNLGGGPASAMSLAELSSWCNERLGPHTVASDPQQRRFDVPWLIMDSRLAERIWNWRPQTSLFAILEEIALHAGQNPQWLAISEGL